MRQIVQDIQYYYWKEIRMEGNFFKSEQQQPLGQLLYSTYWQAQKQETPKEPISIHTNCIKMGNLYMNFTFELRFMAAVDSITFHLGEHEVTYGLPEGNGKLIRNAMKKYLNQPIKKIGRGNFATVYMVECFEDGQKYAVKAFSKEAAYSEENGKECLIKEIEIIRSLNNKHNMRLSQVFESQHSLYIIFELLDGGQLYEKIKAKERFKISQIKRMMQGILEGLREIHSKNIMHRDLKPQNILFRSKDSYDCVIADYGLAEFADLEEYLFVRCGTPGYVAPEVINIKDMKAKYSTICDVFSLGLIFHLLVFGKSVFKGKTYSEVLQENRSCKFDLQAEEYQKVDQFVLDLLKKMLKVNPEERITAEAALSHPFFGDYEAEEKEAEEIEESMDRVEIGESPLMTTSNEARKKDKGLQRDSCLSFKMAKDNVITGKTDTVGSIGSNKVSGFGLGVLKGFKPSKFVKPEEKKQNTAN